MNSDRRRIIKASVSSAVSALPFLSGLSLASEASGTAVAGLSTVSDGNLVLPGNFIAPPDFPKDQLDAFLTENSLSTESHEPACNVSLWQHQDRLVLFDVGAGHNFMPSAGKLLESLQSIDIDPTDVTDVVFTHGHPDHLWGLIDDFDELTFPDANYHIQSAEWDYWRDPDTLNSLPENRKVFAVGAQNRLAYLEDTIKLFEYGDEVLPGVEAIDTSGHTPGHTSFALHDGSESIMILGDAITHPVISFKKPEWPSGGDQDQEQARKTRIKLLDRMAGDKMSVLGFHLPYPGVGFVGREGVGYRFVVE